jgi:hypothetical protein
VPDIYSHFPKSIQYNKCNMYTLYSRRMQLTDVVSSESSLLSYVSYRRCVHPYRTVKGPICKCLFSQKVTKTIRMVLWVNSWPTVSGGRECEGWQWIWWCVTEKVLVLLPPTRREEQIRRNLYFSLILSVVDSPPRIAGKWDMKKVEKWPSRRTNYHTIHSLTHSPPIYRSDTLKF